MCANKILPKMSKPSLLHQMRVYRVRRTAKHETAKDELIKLTRKALETLFSSSPDCSRKPSVDIKFPRNLSLEDAIRIVEDFISDEGLVGGVAKHPFWKSSHRGNLIVWLEV